MFLILGSEVHRFVIPVKAIIIIELQNVWIVKVLVECFANDEPVIIEERSRNRKLLIGERW